MKDWSRKFYIHFIYTFLLWKRSDIYIKSGNCGLSVQHYCERNQREEELSFLDSCASSTRCTYLSLQCDNISWVYYKTNWLFKIFVTKSQHGLLKEDHHQHQNVCAKKSFHSQGTVTCLTVTQQTHSITYYFSPWRYTTHSGCVFYSPLSGFSLLAYEVTWSHTTTRHSR